MSIINKRIAKKFVDPIVLVLSFTIGFSAKYFGYDMVITYFIGMAVGFTIKWAWFD